MSRSPTQPTFNHTRAAQIQAVARYVLSPDEFVRLRDRLATFCGVFLDVARQRMLEQAVARRLQVTGWDFAAYERRLLIEREELQRLAELVLNHETYFFRNQPHIRALREVLLPELHRRKPKGEPIRIWSAGCASGEEAYSLAITALESLPLATRPVQIWATDLSAAALELANEGVYAGRALTNVTPTMLSRYFETQGGAYRVGERVRSLVTFEQLNLLEPLPPTVRQYDLVFCQNVIIYFQQATSRAFLGQLYELLPEGAMLCLGFSETLWNMFDAFRTREVLGAYVYYKETLPAKPETGALSATAPVARRAPTEPLQAPERQRQREPRPSASAAQASGNDDAALKQGRALLESGQIEDALAVLRQIAPHSPSAARAITLIARAHADRGQIDQALAEARRVSELDPMSDEAALLLGVLYTRQGTWDAAVAQLERARYLNNTAPLISFHLAEAYRQHGRADRALREYRNTVWKLQSHPPDTVIDGVAVGWLRETCQRQIVQLSQHISE